MTTLLVINSSPLHDQSVSRSLTRDYVEAWTAANPGGTVIERDASGGAIPHLDGSLVGAFFTPPDQLADAQRDRLSLSDELIAEFKGADEIVFGVPMHNFGVPSSLKAYVDHIVRVGVTFKYTPTGPVGLVDDRKATILVASGGDYSGPPMADFNHCNTWLATILGFLGVRSSESIMAGPLAFGDEPRAAAIAAAQASIRARVAG